MLLKCANKAPKICSFAASLIDNTDNSFDNPFMGTGSNMMFDTDEFVNHTPFKDRAMTLHSAQNFTPGSKGSGGTNQLDVPYNRLKLTRDDTTQEQKAVDMMAIAML